MVRPSKITFSLLLLLLFFLVFEMYIYFCLLGIFQMTYFICFFLCFFESKVLNFNILVLYNQAIGAEYGEDFETFRQDGPLKVDVVSNFSC